MAKIGNEAKLILKLFEERVGKAVDRDDRFLEMASSEEKNLVIQRIKGREDALAILKSIHLEIMEE
jgi:hypothetical protein